MKIVLESMAHGENVEEQHPRGIYKINVWNVGLVNEKCGKFSCIYFMHDHQHITSYHLTGQSIPKEVTGLDSVHQTLKISSLNSLPRDGP